MSIAVGADVSRVVASIRDRRKSTPEGRSTLAAVTGIDGCGKGFVTAIIEKTLLTLGLRVAVINVDGWLNLPDIRFDERNPAEHFYLNAIRFDELFEKLVLPLRERRSIRLEADFTEETASRYRKHMYEFTDVDVIVLEGIYLLKRQLRRHYDLAFWIDCSFETALERAIGRAQEGLSRQATIAAYRTIYFPAQLIHFDRDKPRTHAAIIPNDSAPGAVPAGV